MRKKQNLVKVLNKEKGKTKEKGNRTIHSACSCSSEHLFSKFFKNFCKLLFPFQGRVDMPMFASV